jgi:hypothetical protein
MQDRIKTSGTGPPPVLPEELPYLIELRQADDGDKVERVLARAFTVQLAHAIFKAAQDEHPKRRITLRKGNRIIADSAS